MKTQWNFIIRAKYQLFVNFIGALTFLSAGASGKAQNLFVAALNNNAIYEYTPGGVKSTFAAGVTDPSQLAFNSTGNLFVSSGANIYEYTPGGARSTFASGVVAQGLAFNTTGNLFVSSGANIYEYTPGGVRSTFASGLSDVSYLTFSSAGNLFVATTQTNGMIVEITPGGVRSTFASGLGEYRGLAFNSAGNLFAMTAFEIFEFTPGGTHSTFASGLGQPLGLAFNSAGNLFVGDSPDIYEFTPGGVKSTFAAAVEPNSLAFQGITLPVPEPSALGLLAVSAIALLVRRHRYYCK